jgi:hypothetical protein
VRIKNELDKLPLKDGIKDLLESGNPERSLVIKEAR